MRAWLPALLLLGCGPRVSVTNNDAILELDGYVVECGNRPTIAFPDPDGGWRPSVDLRGLESAYVLDGTRYDGQTCPIGQCNAAEKLTVSFRAIEPTDPDPEHPEVPAYATKRGHGKARVSVDYFADAACSQPRHFEQVITIPTPP